MEQDLSIDNKEMLFQSKKDAFEFISDVNEIIETKGFITVNRLYDMLGGRDNQQYIDSCFGWDEPFSEKIVKSYGKYLVEYYDSKLSNRLDRIVSYLWYLDFPKPKKIQKMDENGITMTEIYSNFKAATEAAEDVINHPFHYKSESGLETIDVIEAFTKNLTGIEATDTGNVIKYICRWKNKNGIEDLKKARWYISHLIDYLEERENSNE